ncbi:MAG TPA: HAD-IB family phosphatase [Acidobacteriaceae bacterium]|nr:HAD-IB family phosphatase [Acidobacteriaceae bacterium]
MPNPHAPLVVDLCGTLIAENTTNDFIDNWLHLSPWRRRLRSLSRGKRPVSVLALRGLTRQVLETEATNYVRDRLASRANLMVIEAIGAARIQGANIYLATASLDCIANAVRNQLRLDGVITAQLGYDRRGRCTGFFAVDTTGRKLRHLHRLLTEEQLRQATLYTDNREDLELLRYVAHPRFLGARCDLARLTNEEADRIEFLPTIMPEIGNAVR